MSDLFFLLSFDKIAKLENEYKIVIIVKKTGPGVLGFRVFHFYMYLCYLKSLVVFLLSTSMISFLCCIFLSSVSSMPVLWFVVSVKVFLFIDPSDIKLPHKEKA